MSEFSPKAKRLAPFKLGFLVKKAGILSLIQDSGRFGYFNIGLTNGGPLDGTAFYWANRLCGNKINSSVIEISLGGLTLIAQVDTVIAVTGAPMPLTINGKQKELWRSHQVKAGDTLALGFSNIGTRSYLAVKEGFNIPLSFGSSSTVCREGIGGLDGGKIKLNDILPCNKFMPLAKEKSGNNHVKLAKQYWPNYSNEIILHTVAGYQQNDFSAEQQALFYSSEYCVTKHSDRMGYRLEGQKITSHIKDIVSEGICHGAIQIPADGQPIVLLNDRQTIGGYPKIGSVIALDTEKLAQLNQGAKVHFTKISIDDAHELFHENIHFINQIKLTPCN